MKKLALLSMLAVLASGALLVHVQASNRKERSMVTPRHDQDEVPSCSNETLEGVYGFSASGTRPAPNHVPLTIEQFITVGTRTFDGHGNFTQISNDKGSLSGILVPNAESHGTYTINPDCSGTNTLIFPGLPSPVVIDIVVVNHGKEFRGIVASPQLVMVASEGRRVN